MEQLRLSLRLPYGNRLEKVYELNILSMWQSRSKTEYTCLPRHHIVWIKLCSSNWSTELIYICPFDVLVDPTDQYRHLESVSSKITMISELRRKSNANHVRGIFLDLSKLTKSLFLDDSTFVYMHNLRYMKIYDSCCPRQREAGYKLNFPDGFRCSLEEVRYLHWLKFPLKELPVDFRPENLVDLSLPYSNLTRVW